MQQLGWASVPSVVKEADDRTLLTLALVENLQRDDLSPIDEAVGYQRLLDEFAVPQQELARIVGRDRSTVANTLRLLKLPEAVRALVHEKKLSEGHARALLALENRAAIERLASEAVAGGWSVRELEARVRGDRPPTRRARKRRALRHATRARTCAASRRRCASAWAPTCGSRPNAAGAGWSRSATTPTTTWRGCSS